MALVVYNTLSGKKEEFVPLKPGKIGMYVCGITAYDSCHLGHARAAVVFDVIVRYLRSKGFDVTYVRNYTDIDDKIINRSNKEGVPCEEITKRYIAEYEEDMKALGVLSPDAAPRATEHIVDMIDTIEKLIKNGVAYELNGSVYFSVRKFPGYGKLSGKNIEELEAGARVEVDETKQDPLDFALWKASKPGEPKWPSPWGDGRPGWHIECSVMSSKYLGQPFDIHGGGRDLIFPHHENEIAQAEGARGCQFVRYWLHNGFININAEKMSKSLGNIKTIKEIRSIFDPEVIRYFLLSSHYRSPIDYTEENIISAERTLVGFYKAFNLIRECAAASKTGAAKPSKQEEDLLAKVKKLKAKFEESMDDDFNTALAGGAVFETMNDLSGYVTAKKKNVNDVTKKICLEFVNTVDSISTVMGFFGSDPEEFLERHKKFGIKRYKIDVLKIEALINERAEARKSKNFARADEIRNELNAMKVELNDRPGGTTEWFVKS
jgi:cysteinyl-tRNA synthetase